MTTQPHAVTARLKLAGVLLCGGAILGGCSYVMGPADTRGGPPPPPTQLPVARQVIANSTDALFDVAANARNVVISELRRFDTALGSEFGVCMRASVADRNGKRHMATYVVFVSNSRVTDRRRALPADGCDRETYQPL